MHHYEKIGFTEVSPGELPKLQFHIIDCPRCGYRHPVPLEYTDWKQVADCYESAYKEQYKTFNKLLMEAGEQFNVPLVEYFQASQQEILESLKSLIKQFEQGKE